MGALVRRVFKFVLIQILFTKVTSQTQPSLRQYLQLSTLARPATPSAPIPTPAASYPPPGNYQKPPTPTPSALSAIASLAALAPSTSKPPSVPKTSNLPYSGLDSNVLNNLAIALQLLIVSNLLNSPGVDNTHESPYTKLPNYETLKYELLPKYEALQKYEPLPKYETLSKYETLPLSSLAYASLRPSASFQAPIPYLDSPRNLYSYETQSVPKANFLGSSNLIESSMYGSAVPTARPNPRSSMTLMSPYEALGPNSPFSDSILSSVYSPTYSKNDLQSPYASMLSLDGNKDLFSVADFL